MPDFAHIHWDNYVVEIIVLLLSITLHEFGHAFSADRLGDPGPRRAGRVNLWPDRHFDPIGFILILWTSLGGAGIGWGKPVMVNPNAFKHPRRDMVIVTACGPLMNLILAVVFGLVIRVALMTHGGDVDQWISTAVSGKFVWSFMVVNLELMFFNLLPIHPLDGGKLLSGALPYDMALKFDRFFYQFGPIIILLVVFQGGNVLWNVLEVPMRSFVQIVTGSPLLG